jgi:mono/diheme cytochrome c family protein
MRPFLLLIVMAMASASGAQTPATLPPGQPAAPVSDVENGKTIYTAYGCYQCHNYAAHGGGAGPRLAPRPIPLKAFTDYVRKPTADMPPYTERVVTNKEIADIYAYLLTIPAPPSVGSIPILNP